MLTHEAWLPPSPTPTRFATPDLILRAYALADAAQLFEAVDESRDGLLPWLPWAKSQHTSEASSRASIELFERERDNLLEPGLGRSVIGIFSESSGRLLGGTGVHQINASRHTGEIGYWVRRSEQRKGICTRAAAAMISWCFLPQSQGGFGLRRIQIFAAAPNTASVAVLTKLGLHRFGILRQERFELGYGWVDTCAFDILAHEWDSASYRLFAT
ncbi:MAG: GNAT family N-acetyltransferase [Phycisphaerae bacterium]|jgi:ribosomal-protein-serine acetyltransferase